MRREAAAAAAATGPLVNSPTNLVVPRVGVRTRAAGPSDPGRAAAVAWRAAAVFFFF